MTTERSDSTGYAHEKYWIEVDTTMGSTEQESVLARLRAKYGPSAYTKHHKNYKLVGAKVGPRRLFSIADSWHEAISGLSRKAHRGA